MSILTSRCAAALALLACTSSPALSQSIAGKLDSIVQHQGGTDSFSGVVLVARGDSTIYQRAVGIANRENRALMGLDTKLQTASVTKLYTQIAIRQLEQAGKLRLTDTLGTFLPRYPNADARRKVTVEHLLTHRSGIGSFWNENFMATAGSLRTIDDYIGLFQYDSLLFDPGTSQAYSNGGYLLLGAIIEKVSGQSYHEYLRTHIFEPAGMRNTLPFDNRVTVANAAVGYTTQAFGAAPSGDRRLAGTGPRPGYEGAANPAGVPNAPSAVQGGGQMQMRLIGPDGRAMTPEQIAEVRAQRAAQGGGQKHPNTPFQAGVASSAGDYFSTVADFKLLAKAILGNRLLDSARTKALLGARYASGEDFRSNGGGPGANAEFSIYPNGYVMIVLANYDPPAATSVAQAIRALISTK
jgi:CubicO group peptidase (beta-lactamase class C family)